ncbi:MULTISPECIES: hypothetical protein [unclassified Acinetobacter]|uniref:hypothetical protein n=1 Tax=unclassified Acinetobacter TaxID=196816 RepID=UPI00257869CF|nr:MULTISPECIES: hypothetical protein [unclassified Acinetobacter]MDM1757451.1 hypothetical protein [Acinetobacter sp. 256-1]MDM1761463.1 hypothetical protein [Acinetobacter sp. 251-1]
MLYNDILDFLNSHHIDHQALPFEVTTHINTLLEPLWRGSQAQLDFSSCASAQKIEFPCNVPIDHDVVQQLIQHHHFSILKTTQSILYFSGSLPCLRVNTLQFQQHLFAFMDEFCYLVTFFLLDPQYQQHTLPSIDTFVLLECSPFDYLFGHVTPSP